MYKHRFFLVFLISFLLLYSISQPSHAQETAEAFYQKAVEYQNSGQYEQAIASYTKAIKLDPENVDAYWNRANLYILQEKYGLAITDCQKVTILKPDFADGHGKLGWYLLLTKRFDEAQKPCEKAFQLKPDNWAWAVNLGHAFLLTGDEKAAREYYKKAIDLIKTEEEFSKGPVADFELFIKNGWHIEASKKELKWMKEEYEKTDITRKLLEAEQDYSDIISFAEGGIEEVAQGKDGSILFQIAEEVAEKYAQKFKKNEILKLIGRYKEYDRKTCKIRLEADEYINKGYSHLKKDQVQEAIKIVIKARDMYQKIGDLAGEAEAVKMIGMLYSRNNQPVDALKYHQMAIKAIRSIGDLAGEVDALKKAGSTSHKHGLYSEAIDYYTQTLEVLRRLGRGDAEDNILKDIERVKGDIRLLENIKKETMAVKAPDSVLDKDSFMLELTLAMKLKDWARLEELIGQGAHFIYEYVYILAMKGIFETAEGKDGRQYFDMAKVFAELYAKTLKRDYLPEQVERYRLYDKEKAGEKLKADEFFRKGISEYQQGRINEGLKKFSEALNMYKKLDDSLEESKVLIYVGQIFYNARLYIESLDRLKKALEIDRNTGNLVSEVDILMRIGGIHHRLEQHSQALTYYTLSTELSRKIGGMDTDAYAFLNMGIIYQDLGRFTEALPNYIRAVEGFRKIENSELEAKALKGAGKAYHSLRRYQESLNAYQQALDIYRKRGMSDESAETFKNIETVKHQLRQQKDENPAIAVTGKKEPENTEKPAIAVTGKKEPENAEKLVKIGAAYMEKGMNDKALDSLRKALEVFRRYQDTDGQAKVLSIMGMIYYRSAEFEQALDTFKKALSIVSGSGNQAAIAGILSSIGNIYSLQGQYPDALEYQMKALETNRKRGNKQAEAMVLLSIGQTHSALGEYDQALAHQKQALEIFQKIGFAEGENMARRIIADLFDILGQTDQALGSYQKVLDTYQKDGNVEGEAKVLASIGGVYGGLGEYKQATENYRQALDIARKNGMKRQELEVIRSMGNVCSILGQNKRALEYYQQALESFRKIGSVDQEAVTLSSMGLFYSKLGRYMDALDAYRQALELFRRLGKGGDDITLIAIGNVYQRLGQYTKAHSFFQEALDATREKGEVAVEASAFLYLGSHYLDLAQYEEALKCYQHALELDQKMGALPELFDTLTAIAVSFNILKQHREAMEYYRQSLEIARKIKAPEKEANALSSMGSECLDLGRHKEALGYIQQALEISRKIESKALEATILISMANIYLDMGQYNSSIKLLQKSLSLLYRSGELEKIWSANQMLGYGLWKTGRASEAVSYYEGAIKAIEEIYTHTKGLKEEERASMFGEKSIVYQEFIELLLELHKKYPKKGFDKKAFTISEKDKSRTFQEMMAKAGAKAVFSGDDTFHKMVEKEQQLLAEVTYLRHLLTNEMSKSIKEINREVIESLKEQSAKAEKSLSGLEKEIDAKYPRYADLKRPKPLSVEDLQSILKPDETLLSYSICKNTSIACVIGKSRFKLVEIGVGREEIVGLIEKFRRGLDDVYDLKGMRKFNPKTAFYLYGKIFQPVASELQGVTRLYISADDLLYTLPFEALVDREFDWKAFKKSQKKWMRGKGDYFAEYVNLHYLIDTYTITYLPSGSVLRSLRKYEKEGYGKWSIPLIAFADPVFSPKEKQVESSGAIQGKGVSKETMLIADLLTRSTGGVPLPRLAESSQEAVAFSAAVHANKKDIYLREKASEENVYKADLKATRYLLFSTHGLLGGDFSGVAEPALAMTLVGNPSGVDGFLTMSEVLELNLNTELTILSACNTYGRGDKAGKGEGFAGLTRSFMYAGSRSLLVTHWSVDSQAARDLMVETFKNVKEKGKPEALRSAKLKMKSATRTIQRNTGRKLLLSHPFFWAPFVIVGDGR